MFKTTKVLSGIAAAFGGCVLIAAAPALAQQTSPSTLERVEVTGSAIKRLDSEGLLPVTIVKAEDLVKQGVTSTEQALGRIAAIQSNFGASASIGGTTGGKAEADLRGLSGPTNDNANKTLVLLNGRRLANHAFDAAAVDLNAIPFAAIDRIEVLRDGASSIYGSDAIGGVINFITKRDYQGLEVSVQGTEPQRSGGGDTQRVNLVGGFGSLDKQGFNITATLDWRKQNVLTALERKFAKTGVIGGAITPGTSGSSFPGDVGGFEPSLPNCAPPLSIPNETGTSCRYDFVGAIDLIPQNEQRTAMVRANVALGTEHTAEFEYVTSNNKATSRVAAAPTTGTILQSSPFWPAGATPQSANGALRDFDPNTPGVQPGSAVNWRYVPAGKRTSGDDTTTQRLLAGLQGTLSGWDYKTALGKTKNKSTASVKNGYVNDSVIAAGVLAGTVNPFGDQSAAGQAVIDSAQVIAPTQIGINEVNFFDVNASREVFQMSGGAAILAVGFEHRREKSSFEALPITAELGSLGIDSESDTAGSRKISAAFVELNMPVVKGIEITAAARYDKYSDVGNSFNPKLGIRWQPTKDILVRSSVNKGFRAPTLYDVYGPQALSFTTDNYDDPLLCPGGVAVPGASEGAVCGQQVLRRAVGPTANGQPANSLKPEKSKAFSFGVGFQVTPELTVGVDFWDLRIRDLISGLPEQQIFGDPTRYAARFIRCSQLSATPDPKVIDRGDADVCANYPSFDPIAYIDQPTENLGELRTRGLDFNLAWRSAPSTMGRFTANLDGTFVDKYSYQREKNGQFISAVGRYSDNAPIFRWQHSATLGWSMGDWGATLGQRYKSGYDDQGGATKVKAYTLWDMSVSWSGIKNLAVTVAVNNLLDKDPPVSGQTTTFQRGYDPRFTDPLGRSVMLRAGYKFW